MKNQEPFRSHTNLAVGESAMEDNSATWSTSAVCERREDSKPEVGDPAYGCVPWYHYRAMRTRQSDR